MNANKYRELTNQLKQVIRLQNELSQLGLIPHDYLGQLQETTKRELNELQATCDTCHVPFKVSPNGLVSEHCAKCSHKVAMKKYYGKKKGKVNHEG